MRSSFRYFLFIVALMASEAQAQQGATNSTIGPPGKQIDKASPGRTLRAKKVESKKPGGVEPLTGPECRGLGGIVQYTTTCGTGLICRTKDSNGNYHWVCITSE